MGRDGTYKSSRQSEYVMQGGVTPRIVEEKDDSEDLSVDLDRNSLEKPPLSPISRPKSNKSTPQKHSVPPL